MKRGSVEVGGMLVLVWEQVVQLQAHMARQLR
jgi:hypothetical protein